MKIKIKSKTNTKKMTKTEFKKSKKLVKQMKQCVCLNV